uniref:Putative secreted peptide n=1 Tax=Anopheles braziliensis TaxID=58242 RepID=A0A2M3ZXI2_9DIPT
MILKRSGEYSLLLYTFIIPFLLTSSQTHQPRPVVVFGVEFSRFAELSLIHLPLCSVLPRSYSRENVYLATKHKNVQLVL